jgi:WD40 repeat protein
MVWHWLMLLLLLLLTWCGVGGASSQVQAAILKLHSRRVTCLEFHPDPGRAHLVFSGSKKGIIASWDMDKVWQRRESDCIS